MLLWRWIGSARRWDARSIDGIDPIDLAPGARLVPVGRLGALLARRGARVNGVACLPLHVLRERDEIAVGGEVFTVSTEAPPEPVPYAADRHDRRCARCLSPLVSGARIVRCPRCDAYHHDDCWASGPACQRCAHPANGSRWRPDTLE